MLEAMTEPALISMYWKTFTVSFVATSAFLAEATLEIPKGWEDLSVKGLMLACIAYLLREQSKERTENKTQQVAREQQLCSTIDKVTVAIDNITAATKTQTLCFEGYGKELMVKGLRGHTAKVRLPGQLLFLFSFFLASCSSTPLPPHIVNYTVKDGPTFVVEIQREQPTNILTNLGESLAGILSKASVFIGL